MEHHNFSWVHQLFQLGHFPVRYEGQLSMVPWHTAYREVRDLRRCQQQVLETHRPLAGAAGSPVAFGSGEAVTTGPTGAMGKP